MTSKEKIVGKRFLSHYKWYICHFTQLRFNLFCSKYLIKFYFFRLIIHETLRHNLKIYIQTIWCILFNFNCTLFFFG